MDYQNAVKVRGNYANIYGDPDTIKLLKSREIDFMINTAVSAGKRALDLCCGAGWLSLELARRGMKVDAIDISPDAIEVAKKFKNDHKINYIVADLNKVKLPKNEYDVVVSYDGLHHVEKMDKLMGEIKNSLKPNGIIIVFDNIHENIISYRLRDKSEDSEHEGVSRGNVVIEIERNFEILKAYRLLSFAIHAIRHSRAYNFPYFLKKFFIKSVRKVDDFFTSSNLFKGEYILIYGRKKS